MNILILSSGSRNKIVQYFKQALTDSTGKRTGRVVACDNSLLAPSIYEADAHYQVPRITDPSYIDIVLDICKKESIDGVLSLIDPELSLLAQYERAFEKIGVTVIGSSLETCELSLDKFAMYEFCSRHGFNSARSWTSLSDFLLEVDAGRVTFPVFVKPQYGSASLAISKAPNRETVEFLFKSAEPGEHLMVQEFLNGQEFGADCYIDVISGELISVFIKKKLLMRAGETDKAVSFKDPALLNLIKQFVAKVGYRGQIDIDIFLVDGKYYISEVNPRFGGGYPHAYECGVDHMKLIVNNLEGKANTPVFDAYEEGMYLMKYNEVMVCKLEDQGA